MNNGKPVIINKGDEPIIIEGGSILLEFDDIDEYIDLLELIKSNNRYEYIIIDGKYQGSFDHIELKKPSDSEKLCEEIKASFNEEKDKYILILSVESTCSKLKWWIILLIVIGILIVLSTGFIILALNNKNLRRYFHLEKEKIKQWQMKIMNMEVEMICIKEKQKLIQYIINNLKYK